MWKIPQLHPGKSRGEAANKKRPKEKSRCSPALPWAGRIIRREPSLASTAGEAWPLRVSEETFADLLLPRLRTFPAGVTQPSPAPGTGAGLLG